MRGLPIKAHFSDPGFNGPNDINAGQDGIYNLVLTNDGVDNALTPSVTIQVPSLDVNGVSTQLSTQILPG